MSHALGASNERGVVLLPADREAVPDPPRECLETAAAFAVDLAGLVVLPVTPADPTDKWLKQALGRVRNLGLGVNMAEAAALLRILNGDNVLDRMASNSTRVAVGALKNMGCIALNDEGVFEATDGLRLALPDL